MNKLLIRVFIACNLTVAAHAQPASSDCMITEDIHMLYRSDAAMLALEHLDQTSAYTLSDLSGKTAGAGRLPNRLETGTLPAGIYQMRIDNGKTGEPRAS